MAWRPDPIVAGLLGAAVFFGIPVAVLGVVLGVAGLLVRLLGG